MTGEKIDFAALCAEFSLVDVVAAAGVKLRRAGREYSGCCPFHAEKSPSFTIYNDGSRERFKCFGCDARGDVVGFIELRYGVPTGEAIRILKGTPHPPAPRAQRPAAAARDDDRDQIAKARALFAEGVPAAGTIAEDYLVGRMGGRGLSPIGGMPASLRFAEVKYWHACPGADRARYMGTFPAMLAPIQQYSGRMTGVHITYIDPATRGKLQLADPDEPAMKLRSKKIRGIMHGGCIRLGPAAPRMMIAEGIETAIAARLAVAGTDLDAPVWTAISLGNFGNIRMPEAAKDVIILADNDMKAPDGEGRKDPRALLLNYAQRISSCGPRVRVAWPDEGTDFNDMLVRAS